MDPVAPWHGTAVPSSGKESQDSEGDPNLVTWDSPTSQENPRNWSRKRKRAVVTVVSCYTLLSPLSSSMIAPALPLLSEQFTVTNSAKQSMMLSVFVLAYAIGPLFLAPLSEMFGRRIVLQCSNGVFLIFSLVCGFAQSSEQLTAFRFFCGLGGSAPLAVGGGTISDLFTPDERGTAMSVYSLAPLLGPCIGPIVGGWIVQGLHTDNRWRWIFWAVTMFGFCIASIGMVILPETYQPRILELKCNRLKKETGNLKLHTIFQLQNNEDWKARFKRNLIRPFVFLATEQVVQLLAIYGSMVYGCMYLILTTFSEVFVLRYHESVGISSLNYFSLAVGFSLGGQIGGRLVDRIYRYFKEQNDGVGQPEFKLPLMMATSCILPVGILLYGWSAEYAVHWIVPNIGSALFGFGLMGVFLSIQNYLVDQYSLYAASALSAAAFLRSLAGFGFPLFAPAMYKALGYGIGNTILAAVTIVIGIPAPFLLWKFGPWLRARSNYSPGGKGR
ncbi:MFS general substrate transporter [Tilletiaria anomala UBC 951]|uniref:MFS general substrate transporter n=1 Tax=Tilletiaria anomala (strain ATCC 24038 / CBS 436.72 / UBC 951) TaxID=1037660 RepID=A0A066VT83_TILAU|nr:MFS general substrate transporter [Tilletiaria anomala UBC 951]KDN41785.1 MFS general substrate transporter [Tilletiaria anomala UBC 951]